MLTNILKFLFVMILLLLVEDILVMIESKIAYMINTIASEFGLSVTMMISNIIVPIDFSCCSLICRWSFFNVTISWTNFT